MRRQSRATNNKMVVVFLPGMDRSDTAAAGEAPPAGLGTRRDVEAADRRAKRADQEEPEGKVQLQAGARHRGLDVFERRYPSIAARWVHGSHFGEDRRSLYGARRSRPAQSADLLPDHKKTDGPGCATPQLARLVIVAVVVGPCRPYTGLNRLIVPLLQAAVPLKVPRTAPAAPCPAGWIPPFHGAVTCGTFSFLPERGTVSRHLSGGFYHSPEEFRDEVHTTFNNAMLFNPPGNLVHENARRLKTTFDRKFSQVHLPSAPGGHEWGEGGATETTEGGVGELSDDRACASAGDGPGEASMSPGEASMSTNAAAVAVQSEMEAFAMELEPEDALRPVLSDEDSGEPAAC
eukprot:scaffold15352_cov107-Isochrysis_galbana.AAC.4